MLSEKEELLVKALRALPRDAADQVITWASHLAELSKGRPVEWSDEWSDEDLRDATSASLRNFEEAEPI